MSSKLDQSLEEIAGPQRNNARRARRPGKPRTSTGGVTKNTAPAKPTKGQSRAATAAAAAVAPTIPATGESKIIVSNLPTDVTEAQIKEYFTKTVGSVKKVLVNYNKSGRSVGVATIIFSQATSAAKAAKDLDGATVDNKRMKIEVILGAQYAPTPAAPKSLKDRIAQPKKEANKPKSAAAAPKPAAVAGGASKKAARGGRKGGRTNRPKPKTVEELDAEMSEYFEPNAAAGQSAPVTNGAPAAAAAPAAGGDATMEDEIM